MLTTCLQLTPVERFALKFMETSEECWSVEQLRAAEAQIEEQKKAWELKRLAAMSGNDDERGFNHSGAGDPDGLLTYPHQDSVNQVKKKPGKPRNKSKLSQTDVTPSSEPPTSGKRIRRRTNHVSETPPVAASIKLADSTTESIDVLCESPSLSRRKRTRAVRSETATPEALLDDALGSSPSLNNTKALSPRTRSRGTVNINLWTLDARPLIPSSAKATPSPKSIQNKVKDRCSPSPVVNEVFSNGCEPENMSVPCKKVRVLSSTDLEPEPDLDVVS